MKRIRNYQVLIFRFDFCTDLRTSEFFALSFKAIASIFVAIFSFHYDQMKFISAISTIRHDSSEHVRRKIEKNATLIINTDTVDQVDFYTIKMRVHVRGRGEGFHIEVPTDLILKETSKGIELIAYSSLSKVLILSAGMGITVAAVFLFSYNLGPSLFSFLIVFSITSTALVITIKRRASQLLRYFADN